MRVRHFNIVGVAWSNFKPGINTDGRFAIFNNNATEDVVKMSAGVVVIVVALTFKRGLLETANIR